MLSLRPGHRTALFFKVKSTNGKYHGLIWHSYLTYKKHLNKKADQDTANLIVAGFDDKIYATRVGKVKTGSKFNVRTFPSVILDQLAETYMRQLTKMDYQKWSQQQYSGQSATDRISVHSANLAQQLSRQTAKKYCLTRVALNNYGYVSLKKHPSNKAIVKSLVHQITQVGPNAQAYSDSPNNLLYTGEAVHIDRKKQALYMTAVIGVDEQINAKVKKSLAHQLEPFDVAEAVMY